MSQIWAMYALVMLYYCIHDEIMPLKPLQKFLCVKSVVFLTFWQSILIGGLVQSHVIGGEGSWSTSTVAKGCQDFAICVEMFAAAIGHHYYMSWHDFCDKQPVSDKHEVRNPVSSSSSAAHNNQVASSQVHPQVSTVKEV